MDFEAIFQALMTDEKAAQVLLGDDFAAAFAKAKSLEAGITEDQFRAFIAERKQHRANLVEFTKFIEKAQNDTAFVDKVASSTPDEAYELAKDVVNLDKETFLMYLGALNTAGKIMEQQEGEIDDDLMAAVAGGADVMDKTVELGKKWWECTKDMTITNFEDRVKGITKLVTFDFDGASEHAKKVFKTQLNGLKKFWGSLF